MTKRTPKIGLALGSGSARGLSHIGIIKELEKMGIRPDVVCGTSIGAIVGAFYVSGKLAALEEYVLGLDTWNIIKMMDVGLLTGGGLIEGERFMSFLQEQLGDLQIEELGVPFAAVATDMETGQEVWFREGSLNSAVRASISLPILLTPFKHEEQWLLDGGLVNPVPVSVCRALGANKVIAVNLNSELVGTHFQPPVKSVAPAVEGKGFFNRLSAQFEAQAINALALVSGEEKPGILDVLATFIDIMQDRITRSRMAGDPPEVMLVPRLKDVALLDFDKAAETIAVGEKCVHEGLPALQHHLGL